MKIVKEDKGHAKNGNIAFVAMCFDKRLHHIYVKVVKPVLEISGFTCIRADEIKEIGLIVDQIRDLINKSVLFLCDLTYENPNVFYELGIAHVLDKPTLMLSQTPANIPFDVKHLRVIPYADDKIGLLELRDSLVEFVKNNFKLEHNNIIPTFKLKALSSNEEIMDQRTALFSNSIDIKRYAIKYLGDCQDKNPATFSKIEMIAVGDQNQDIVRECFTSLHKIDPKKALPLLLDAGLLHQKEFLARERVVYLIGNYEPTDELVERLIKQLGDSSWGVRRAACEILGRWGKKEAIGPLQKMLSDPESAVRLAAAEALERSYCSK